MSCSKEDEDEINEYSQYLRDRFFDELEEQAQTADHKLQSGYC